jgi:hypothetical protein
MTDKIFATNAQKEDFKERFAKIVEHNDSLNEKYSIQFFDTPTKSNYVIKGLDGKSMNVNEKLSFEEIEEYKELKSSWQVVKKKRI